MQEENKSKVAQLMRQIELEYEAAQQGLTGYAEVAKHAFITARLEKISEHHASLQQLIGEQKAAHFLVTVFEGNNAGSEEAQGEKGEPSASTQKSGYRGFASS